MNIKVTELQRIIEFSNFDNENEYVLHITKIISIKKSYGYKFIIEIKNKLEKTGIVVYTIQKVLTLAKNYNFSSDELIKLKKLL